MGRRKKKKFIDRWWVKFLMVAAAIFLIGAAGMNIWSSEAVQTRFVYMWPYQNEILEYSSKNKIDPFLVAAVIKNESGFDTEAVSHAGAVGLMQIMPETGEWIASQMGIDHFDMEALRRPEYNVRLGCWYLGELEQNDAFFDEYHAQFPDRCIRFSEYGADPNPAYQSPTPEKGDYTESYQPVYPEHIPKTIEARPWL